MAVVSSSLTLQPFLAHQSAFAQSNSQQSESVISGTVVDSHGETVIGASVLIVGKGVEGGVSTDINGQFRVKAKPGTKLKISYIGMESKVVVAKNGMKVVLADDDKLLEDVQVVAYGVQKKVTVTGAISTVKAEDLTRTSVGSINNVLGGQLSGVTTVQFSGEPGSDAADIFVRGKATFNNDNAKPLIQVDGVERDMYDIDPNEIESVTVLKDASATAVFGVRGANGVILITTKRGQEGKAKISLSASFSALTPTKMVEQTNSYDYAMFYNQMCSNDGRVPVFSDAVIQKFKDGSDPIRFPNTRWADYIMKDVTLQQQHNLSISGGTKKVQYFISAGFYSQDGLFKEFDAGYDYGYQYHRFNYRANVDLHPTNTTKLSIGMSGNMNNADKPYTGQGSGGMIKNIYHATPFSSPGIVDGRMVYTTTDYTDGLQLPFTGQSGMAYYGNGFMQTNNNKIMFDLALEQKLDMIVKGLVFSLKGAYNSYYGINKQGQAGVASYYPLIQPDGSIVYRKDGETTVPSYTSSSNRGRNYYYEGGLRYSGKFGLHNVSALALYNFDKTYYYRGDALYTLVPRGYVGFCGRVAYDYNNKYMAEFNVGYNGSENFAPDRRFAIFPAGSVGWVVSEEKFWEPIKEVFSFMKVRYSVGLVGNDRCSTRFGYLPDPYVVNSDGLPTNAYAGGEHHGYTFGQWAAQVNGTLTSGAYESRKNDPSFTWEKALKHNIGVDMNFFDSKLRTSVDYYTEHRWDILCRDLTSPSIIGVALPESNLGIVDSHGWEFSIGYNDKIGSKFRYWAKLNFSYNWNKIVEMKEAPQTEDYLYSKNHRIGSRSQYQFWKYYEGDKTKDEYKATFGSEFPTHQNVLQPGDCVYVDLNHDGKIDASDATRDLGHTDDPKYMAGLNFGFEWKRLSFNAQMTSAWGVSRVISDVFRQPFLRAADTVYGGLLQYHVDNTWTVDNPNPNADYPRATWDNATNNYAGSTLYEKDSKYLRLKTLSIGYDLINPFFKRLGMSRCILSVSGYNLFTVTPYKWGDPETIASNAPSYPLQRTFTVGLNVGF